MLAFFPLLPFPRNRQIRFASDTPFPAIGATILYHRGRFPVFPYFSSERLVPVPFFFMAQPYMIPPWPPPLRLRFEFGVFAPSSSVSQISPAPFFFTGDNIAFRARVLILFFFPPAFSFWPRRRALGFFPPFFLLRSQAVARSRCPVWSQFLFFCNLFSPGGAKFPPTFGD